MQAAGRAVVIRVGWPGLAQALQRGLQWETACSARQGEEQAEADPSPVLRVEYCVLCNYKPRFELLRDRVRQEFPGLAVQEDTEDHRPGSFEVALQQGSYITELWSKLITGEPSNLEATCNVAELVVRDLRRYLPRAVQQRGPAAGETETEQGEQFLPKGL